MAVTSRSAAKSKGESNIDPVVNAQNLGKLGGILGSAEQAPIYIAGIIAIVSLFGAILMGMSADIRPEKLEVIKILVSVVIASITFLAGIYAGASKK